MRYSCALVLLLLHVSVFALSSASSQPLNRIHAAAAGVNGGATVPAELDSSSFHSHSSQQHPVSTPPLPMHPHFAALPVRTMEAVLADARAAMRQRAAAAVTVTQSAASTTVAAAQDLPAVPNVWDPRVNSSCPSLLTVRDQGNCAADWAASVAAAMSDRICIQSNGTKQPTLSITDILSCCGWACGLGCSGGYSFNAWTYLHTTGVVSGEGFNVSGNAPGGGCLPYALGPCVHNLNGTEIPCDSVAHQTRTPVCVQACQNGARWADDKQCGGPPYRLPPGNVSLIQAEIFHHGPVTATMQLFQDFSAQLPNSVYSYRQGHLIGALSVKILGWGSDFAGTVDYWIVANSWGSNWAANQGFFKIKRGTNECNIEATAMAAIPQPCQWQQPAVPAAVPAAATTATGQGA